MPKLVTTVRVDEPLEPMPRPYVDRKKRTAEGQESNGKKRADKGHVRLNRRNERKKPKKRKSTDETSQRTIEQRARPGEQSAYKAGEYREQDRGQP